MHRLQLRRTHVGVAALFTLVACSKGDSLPKDSGALKSALKSAPGPAVMPGTLTKPIDSYTGDEFYAFVQKLAYSGGHDRDRDCKNDPACQDPGLRKHTIVRVEAITTQDSLAPSNMPKFGVVYLRAVNKGDAEEARYGLKPGSHNEYYMIITADSVGGMQYRLELLDTKARQHSLAGAGAFTSCNHAWVAGARADFKTCASSASARDSVVRLGLSLQGGLGDPLWAACAGGCCIGQ